MERETRPELEKMRMGVEYSFPVKLRGFEVILRPLSNSEMMQAKSLVASAMANMKLHERSEVMEHNELAKEFLERASSPFGEFAPKLPKSLLNEFTNDELMYFYREYLAVCDRVNPALEELPQEALMEMVEMVKKNPSQEIRLGLISLSFGQLTSLALYLLINGERPTDKSSGGSPIP